MSLRDFAEYLFRDIDGFRKHDIEMQEKYDDIFRKNEMYHLQKFQEAQDKAMGNMVNKTKYTVQEIDMMRSLVEQMRPKADMSGVVTASDLSPTWVEDRLRTYIAAGLTSQDLRESLTVIQNSRKA